MSVLVMGRGGGGIDIRLALMPVFVPFVPSSLSEHKQLCRHNTQYNADVNLPAHTLPRLAYLILLYYTTTTQPFHHIC